MLSFKPGQKLENELRILQGTLVESYTNIENLSPEEAKYLLGPGFSLIPDF